MQRVNFSRELLDGNSGLVGGEQAECLKGSFFFRTAQDLLHTVLNCTVFSCPSLARCPDTWGAYFLRRITVQYSTPQTSLYVCLAFNRESRLPKLGVPLSGA